MLMGMTRATMHRAPSLENGDRLDREEFHRRALLRPDLKSVELIEGVVYVQVPTNPERHALPLSIIQRWLYAYCDAREGLTALSDVTIMLDNQNEPMPDAILYRQGRMERPGGWLEGAPELVVEISNTSAARDLHQKKEAYRRNGVKEYIVWRTVDGMIDWFALENGEYAFLEPDADGVIESREFPGLRLDVPAALALDRAAVLAALQR